MWVEFETAADEALKSVTELTTALIGKSSTGLIHLMRCSGFSDAEIRRMSSDFIIAAADTTFYTILWCLHLLASHQQQEIARRESLTSPDEDKLDTTRLKRALV